MVMFLFVFVLSSNKEEIFRLLLKRVDTNFRSILLEDRKILYRLKHQGTTKYAFNRTEVMIKGRHKL